MNVRCFTIQHPRVPQMCVWRVEVDRPDAEGGPFSHDFKGTDAVFYAARMANKWRGLQPKRKTTHRQLTQHRDPVAWNA